MSGQRPANVKSRSELDIGGRETCFLKDGHSGSFRRHLFHAFIFFCPCIANILKEGYNILINTLYAIFMNFRSLLKSLI